MKVGTALNMRSQAGRSDVAVVGEHLALADLAEALGFDSLSRWSIISGAMLCRRRPRSCWLIDAHGKYSDGHLASVRGNGSYEKTGQTYAKMKEQSKRQNATEF
jgi:hypothetical protein